MKPSECKWCGATKSGEDGDDILFSCGSWHSGSTPEYQYAQCELNVAQRRIRRAIETLKAATRYELVRDEYGCYMKGRDSYGNWLDAIEIEKLIEILEGRSNEQTD